MLRGRDHFGLDGQRRMSSVAKKPGGVFTSREDPFAEYAPVQAYRHRQRECCDHSHRVGAELPPPQQMLIFQTPVIRHPRLPVTQCLVGPYDILKPPLRGCIPRVEVGMQLLSQAPEGSFDLFVRRFSADAKYLIEFVHERLPSSRADSVPIALGMGLSGQAQYCLCI